MVRQSPPIEIRQATSDDEALVWPILEPVIREGTTYPLDPRASRAEIGAYWFAPDKAVFVALRNGAAAGTYTIRPNSTGPAAHVANAGYMVHPAERGRGMGRALALDSFLRAKAMGFRAMQFNLVVSTNAAAIHLWRSVGMEEVGRLREAFRLPGGDYVDALVMYRLL